MFSRKVTFETYFYNISYSPGNFIGFMFVYICYLEVLDNSFSVHYYQCLVHWKYGLITFPSILFCLLAPRIFNHPFSFCEVSKLRVESKVVFHGDL